MESNTSGSIFGVTIFFIISDIDKYKSTFKYLEERDSTVLFASRLTDVFNLIQSNKPDVIISEEFIEDIKQGQEILRKLNLIMQNRSKLILITDVIPHMCQSDLIYLTKPFSIEDIFDVISKSIQTSSFEEESLLRQFSGIDFDILIMLNGQTIESELIDIRESTISFELKEIINTKDTINLLVTFKSHESEQKVKVAAVMTNSKEIEKDIYLVEFSIDHQSKDDWGSIYREILRIQHQATNFIKVSQN